MISPKKISLPDSTQHLQETDIPATGGIRTRNPSKCAATDPHFWGRGHWNWRQLLAYGVLLAQLQIQLMDHRVFPASIVFMVSETLLLYFWLNCVVFLLGHIKKGKGTSYLFLQYKIIVSFKFTEKEAAISNFYIVSIIIIIIIIIITLLVHKKYMMFLVSNNFKDACKFLVFISFTRTTLDRPVDCQQPRGWGISSILCNNVQCREFVISVKNPPKNLLVSCC